MKLTTNTIILLVTAVLSIGLIAVLVLSKGDEPRAAERELIELAESIGMDGDQFLEDYRSDEVRGAVDDDVEYAEDNLERISTPTVRFDGELADTPGSYEDFSAAISEAIEAKDSDEPLEIEVFEDFQCPYCSQFFPMPYQAEAEFGDSIEVIHIHLPLTSIHPQAESYAWAAEAAKKQDKYVEMSTAIFKKEHGANYQIMRDLGLVE
jgi:protein-disulfide isomerase